MEEKKCKPGYCSKFDITYKGGESFIEKSKCPICRNFFGEPGILDSSSSSECLSKALELIDNARFKLKGDRRLQGPNHILARKASRALGAISEAIVRMIKDLEGKGL